MPLGSCPELFHVRHTADATIARFVAGRLDSSNTEALGRQFTELAAVLGRQDLRLDLGAVRYVSSEPLGKVVALHRQVREAGGRLVLENVQPLVYEVLAATQLTRLLDIQRAEDGKTWPLTRSA